MSGRKSWGDLDPGLRQILLLAAAFEGGLKVACLIDLARRPTSEIRGSKVAWASALALINSAGVLPVAYLLRGRQRAG